MHLTIGTRILIASALIVVVAFALFTAYFTFNQRAAIGRQLRSNVNETATLATAGIENWITSRRLLMENVGQNVALDTTGEVVMKAVSRPILEEIFEASYFGSAAGEMLLWPQRVLPSDYDPRLRPWYRDAVEARSSTLTEPYQDSTTGDLIVTMATPVMANEQVLGVVGGDLNIGVLAELVRGLDLGGIGQAFLVNDQGTVLIHRDPAMTLQPLSKVFDQDAPALRTDLEASIAAEGGTIFAFYPLDGLPSVEWQLGFAIDRQAAFASLSEFRRTAALIAVITVLAIIALLHLLVRSWIARPVNGITDAMATLADGDLGIEIPGAGKRDEIGRMAQSLRHFQAKLVENERLRDERVRMEEDAKQSRHRAILGLADRFEESVGSVVQSVSSAAVELQASSDTMATSAKVASDQTTSAAGAVGEASSNVTVVASASEELSASIREISSQVSESSRIAAGAVEEVQSTGRTVEQLSLAAQAIGSVIELINGIAEQTNLLALNATIEAARAGEAGKGFAVVAQEVKSLAEQTSKATDEIAAQINTMQSNTQSTVEAMRSVGTTIGRMNDIAAAIAAAVEEQSAATQEISANAGRAAHGTSEAAGNISRVQVSANEVGHTAANVKTASDELAAQADRLRTEVSELISNIRAG